jgi:hypothetical protein
MRTGANLEEGCLTTDNVNQEKFGFLFSRTVDGQIYAQPLYVPGVVIPDKGVHNVVYVATMHNTVYAFDADDSHADKPLWDTHLGDPVDFDFMPMKMWWMGAYNIRPEIGITSTPVIDLRTNTIYLTAKIKTGSGPLWGLVLNWGEEVEYRLYALDIRTGKKPDFMHLRSELSPDGYVVIEAYAFGDGEGSKNGIVRFDPVYQLQRPGLLLVNSSVYLAFASHQDTEPYHGWVLAYDASTLKQTAVYCSTCTTKKASEGGIWQSGNGPAADEQGNVYVMTGNGTFNYETNEFGSSFVKLDPILSVSSWFTPSNYKCLNIVDADLGSAGPLLIPDTNLLVGGGKEGVLFLLDRNDLGGRQLPTAIAAAKPCTDEYKGSSQPPLDSFQAGPPWEKLSLFYTFLALLYPDVNSFGYHHIHGSPVFWNSPLGNLIYVWAERDYLRVFRLDPLTKTFPGTAPAGDLPRATYRNEQSTKKGMPGASLSISANESVAGTGIIWASLPNHDKDALRNIVPGVLHAFEAAPNAARCPLLEDANSNPSACTEVTRK